MQFGQKMSRMKERLTKKSAKKPSNPKKCHPLKDRIQTQTKNLSKAGEKKRVNGKKLPCDITPEHTEATLVPCTRGSCNGVRAASLEAATLAAQPTCRFNT